MKKIFVVITCIFSVLTNAKADIQDYIYDGKEVYLHVKKNHITTVIFPEPVIRVIRSFGADAYVIEHDGKYGDTLELMPTDSETAEMNVEGLSGEDYVLRCIVSDNYYTKFIMHRLGTIASNGEAKGINPRLDLVPEAILEKRETVSHSLPTLNSAKSPMSDNIKLPSDLPPELNLRITLRGNDIPLKRYLSTISQATNYNIITTPEIDAQKTSLNLVNIEVWRALKSMLYKFSWGFKVSKDDLIITSLETRVFNIRIPAVEQTFTDLTSNASYTNSQNTVSNVSNSVTNQQPQDVKVGTKISYENTAPKLSLWADLENSIKSMITPQTGSYSISRSSGSIIVTDKPGILDKIGEYIDSTNNLLSRQQTFEIQIYEVSLSDMNETGIDWTAVEKSMKGIDAVNLSTNFTTFGFSQGQLLSLSGNTSNSGANGVAAILKALASQGNVHTISKPRITVTNLFPAVLQEVTSVPYISGTGETISSQSTVSNVTTSQVSDGLTMRLDAKISEDNNTVLNIAVAVNTLDSMTSVPVGGGLTIQEPQVSTKSITTNVDINPNKTLILGGLMSSTKNNSIEGIPYLSKIPFLGNVFSYKRNSISKSELIIIITPKGITKDLV